MIDPIRFQDGAAYDRYMGQWSQLAGHTFLAWLSPPSGLRWLDVGCGNGAFTELILTEAAPSAVTGIDPSPDQLTFARKQPSLRSAQFHEGDAMALPFGEATFDVAVMPLVIFFVPDPARGVAEMARVVSQDGWVAAYAWDMERGGFPYHALLTEMREMGIAVPEPPSPEASRTEHLRDLWIGAGLTAVSTREIAVLRTFPSFDDYWETVLGAPSVGGKLRSMSSVEINALRARMRARLPQEASGSITYGAFANAIQGRVPRRTPA